MKMMDGQTNDKQTDAGQTPDGHQTISLLYAHIVDIQLRWAYNQRSIWGMLNNSLFKFRYMSLKRAPTRVSKITKSF